MRAEALTLAVCGAWLVAARPISGPAGEPVFAEDILAKSRVVYASLKSYSDSGTVAAEFDGFVERAKFRTRYRAPNDFLLEYRGQETEYSTGLRAENPAHHVLWMVSGNLERWDAGMKTHERYPAAGGQQVEAVAGSAAYTAGTSVLIPSLLFSKTRLVGTLQEIADASVAGTENVNGRPCHKVVGVARSVYPTGQVFNVRPVVVWIDTETLLIRKVFTDTPQGYPVGAISRLTVTLNPHLNPTLTDSSFRFTIPSQ